MLIPEIYPGIEEEATRVGADVLSNVRRDRRHCAWSMSFGNASTWRRCARRLTGSCIRQGCDVSSLRPGQGHLDSKLLVGWAKRRSLAREPMKKPGQLHRDDRIKLLGCSRPFRWPVRMMKLQENRFSRGIEKNERDCIHSGLRLIPWAYISPRRVVDYTPKQFLPSYRGLGVLLIQQHRPVQFVTPRTACEFSRQNAGCCRA